MQEGISTGRKPSSAVSPSPEPFSKALPSRNAAHELGGAAGEACQTRCLRAGTRCCSEPAQSSRDGTGSAAPRGSRWHRVAKGRALPTPAPLRAQSGDALEVAGSPSCSGARPASHAGFAELRAPPELPEPGTGAQTRAKAAAASGVLFPPPCPCLAPAPGRKQ